MRPLLLWLFVLVAQTPRSADIRPIVDYHQHLFSPTITTLSSRQQLLEAKDLVALLDEAGIRRAVVLSLAYQYGNPNRAPVEHEYDKVKAENDWTSAQVAQHPDRLRGFCAVNPLKAYALEEVDRCAKDLHLRTGLKMHFGNSDVDLGNPDHVVQVRRIVAAANRHGMAILVHARSTVSMKRPYGADRARFFLEEVLPAAPDVPLVIAHLAGAGGYEALADEALGVYAAAIAKRDPRMARVYFDVSGVAGLGNWREKKQRIAERIRQLGVDRVLYGSDGAGGSNPPPSQAWASFRELPLTEQEFSVIANNLLPFMK
jgi:predicted TIM-barrel fold metal-dependent hydrolase